MANQQPPRFATSGFDGRHYHNPVPTEVMKKGAFFRVLGKYMKRHEGRVPATSPGPFSVDLEVLNNLPPDTLRVTWLGHSGSLLEVDGRRFLTDPLWCERASPVSFAGPRRFFQNPLPLADLPPVDCLLLSHDHFDHLDKESVLFLCLQKKIPVITMRGVGKRLTRWGVPAAQVAELDWWEATSRIDGFTVTAAPARHFSGRSLTDRFTTLWGSFAIRGPRHNVYFGADSGYYDGFGAIGEALGPFDLTMLEIGAYDPEWSTIHMGPEGAVNAWKDIGSGLLMPIHWGTFNLALHAWTQPVESIVALAKANDIPLLLPRPGETRTVADGEWVSGWWRGES
ncbi:MAG: fold metallo-hydrolase [Flaviaesturariibacter sp.]|nr:fold metallo-hydrolase [Flaviaesturariibacter sp.]